MGQGEDRLVGLCISRRPREGSPYQTRTPEADQKEGSTGRGIPSSPLTLVLKKRQNCIECSSNVWAM